METIRSKKEKYRDTLQETLLIILNTSNKKKRHDLIKEAIHLNNEMLEEMRHLSRQLAKERDFKNRIMKSIKETLQQKIDPED